MYFMSLSVLYHVNIFYYKIYYNFIHCTTYICTSHYLMYHDEANTLSNQPWLQTNRRGNSRSYRCTTWNAVVVWGLCVHVLMCQMFIWKRCLVMKHFKVRLLSVTSQTSRVLSFAAETVRRGPKAQSFSFGFLFCASDSSVKLQVRADQFPDDTHASRKWQVKKGS